MEKIKGYLGLLLALAMLILFKTLPSNYPYSTTLTPFDNNAVTRLVLQGSSDLKLWQNATNALGFCRDKDKGKSQSSYYYGSYDCAKQLSQNIYAYSYLGDLFKLNPELADLTREYLRDYSEKNEENYPNEPSIVFFHREFSSTILEYIKSTQAKLRFQIYLINTLYIGLIFLTFVFRRRVGAAIAYPFMFFWILTSKIYGLAKKLHKKI